VCLKLFQATAAFDGIHSSKWEEPDGAKGYLVALYTKRSRILIPCFIHSLFCSNEATQIDAPSAAIPFS